MCVVVVVVYPLPCPLLGGEWSTRQLLRPSRQQFRHSSVVCPHIQGLQHGSYVGSAEEMGYVWLTECRL